MGFNDKLKKILDKEKPKMITRSCSNFWCKVRYEISDRDFENYREFYSTCPKCRSFDTELSGGVTNNGQRNYEGDRFDNGEHEVTIREHQVGLRN